MAHTARRNAGGVASSGRSAERDAASTDAAAQREKSRRARRWGAVGLVVSAILLLIIGA